MKRATVLLVAAGILLAAGPARGDQTWTQNQHATNLATGAQFSLDGLPTPVLGKHSPLRLDDLTLCAGGPLWVNATALPFRCATIGNTAGGADLQAPLAPADGSIVMPTAGTIRVGAVPGTAVTGTPNTVAYFNGSGLLNSLTLAPEFTVAAGTLSLAANGVANAKLATMPARSFKVNATNATGTPSDLACTGAGQVPQDTGTSLVCQQLSYGSLSGSPPAITSLTGPITATGPGAAATSITNGAVTYPKIQNETGGTFLGNPTGSTAPPSEITPDGTSVAFAGSTLQRLALTGAVTAAAGSGATAFGTQAGSSVFGVAGTATAVPAPIVATTANTVPTFDGTTVAFRAIGPATTTGVVANWPIGVPRIFAVDGVNGNDANKGWADPATSSAADVAAATQVAGAVAKKTFGGLIGVFPTQGTGHKAAIVIASGTYSDSVLSVVNGTTGYANLVIRGTGTGATAGATAFDGSAADLIYVGAKTAPSMNSSGYNPTAGATTTVIPCRINGGGSVTFPAEPGSPDGYRIRFSSTTATTALRNQTGAIVGASGATLTLSHDTALPATPATGDVFYLEAPGVTMPGPPAPLGLRMDGGGLTGFISNALIGISITDTIYPQGDMYFGFVTIGGISGGNGVPLSIDSTGHFVGLYVYVDGVSFPRVGGAGRIDGFINFDFGSNAISLPGFVLNGSASPPIASSDAQTFYIGDGAITYPRLDVGGKQSNSFSGITIGGATDIGERAMRAISDGARSPLALGYMVGTVGAIDATQAGVNPAIRIIGQSSLTFRNLLSGSAGNSDVGVDLTAAFRSSIVLVTRPTITGALGDLRLCTGTIITWAQASAGIVDPCGNQIAAQTYAPLTVSTSGTSITGLGTGHVTVTSDRLGVDTTTYLADPGTNGIVVRTAPGTVITGQLSGPVTTTGTSLATSLNLGAGGITGSLALSFLAQGGATTNQALTWSGTTWAPATVGTSGPAGGALTGTYPNPSIANGVIVPANFSAFPANTLFGNPTGSSAIPTTITLGAGLAFSAGALTSTVTGGADALGTYWVSSATHAPANAVNWGLLGNGVHQQTTSGSVSTPSVFTAGVNQMAFGAASGGGLQTDPDWILTPSTHAVTASGSFSSQGPVTTIGNWSGMGTYASGVVGAFSATNHDIPYGAASGGVFTQSNSFQYDGAAQHISSADGSGNSLYLDLTGTQAVWKIGSGDLWFGSSFIDQVIFAQNGAPRFKIRTDGNTEATTNLFIDGVAANSLVRTDSTHQLVAASHPADYLSEADMPGNTLILYSQGVSAPPGGDATFSWDPTNHVLFDGGADASGNAIILFKNGTQAIEKRTAGDLWMGSNFIDKVILYQNGADRLHIANSGGIEISTSLLVADMAGPGTRCVHVDPTGFFSPTASDCGTGSGGGVTGVTASAPLTSSGGTAPNIALSNSGVSAGTYVTPTITVDATGRVTAASFTNTYQTVESDGTPVTGEATLNFHTPLHAADNSSPFRTEITINDFVGSGSSHARGIVPDPGSTAGSRRFLNESAAWIVPPVAVTSADATPDYLINKIGSTTGSVAVSAFAGGPSGLEVNLNVNPAGISLSSPMEAALNYTVSYALSGAGTPGGWYAVSSLTPGVGFLAGAFAFEYPLGVSATSATLKVKVLLNGSVSDSTLIQITRNGTAIGAGVTVDSTTTAGTILSYTTAIAGGAASDVYGVKSLGSGSDVSGNIILDATAVIVQ